MRKLIDLISHAAKSVMEEELRMCGGKDDVKQLVRDVYLECARNYYRLELLKGKSDTGYGILAVGCVEVSQLVTTTLMGVCLGEAKPSESNMFVKVSHFLNKTLQDFIGDYLVVEVRATEAIEDFAADRVDFETARNEILRHFKFLCWQDEDFDSCCPQKALLWGTDLDGNEKVKELLESSCETYLYQKQLEEES